MSDLKAIILGFGQCLVAGMFLLETSLMAHERLDSLTVSGLYSLYAFGLRSLAVFLVDTNI
jgi:hypothetical protein